MLSFDAVVDMEIQEMKREIFPGGKVGLRSEDCTFTFERTGLGKLLVTIIGDDHGQFGTSTLDEILIAIQREGHIELFVDARSAKAIAVDVSEAWTRFFMVNRDKLLRVHVLVASEYIHLTVAIAQHLSGTGELIRIHSKDDSFFGTLSAMKNTKL